MPGAPKLELRGEKEKALEEIHDISYLCSEEMERERQRRNRLTSKCNKKTKKHSKSKQDALCIHGTT